ncbi:hypothetical protein D3C84_973380 [compost metagenome]
MAITIAIGTNAPIMGGSRGTGKAAGERPVLSICRRTNPPAADGRGAATDTGISR